MKFVNIPGLFNSGPSHWQSLWEDRFKGRFERVLQDNWNDPDKEHWVKRLDETVRKQDEPFIVVAHSLGCISFIHWASQYKHPMLAGALLVAPADVENSSRLRLAGFSPVPRLLLPCPALTVASANDPYASLQKVQEWSKAWGSQFVNIGFKGHINAESGLDIWPEGIQWLNQLEHHASIRSVNEIPAC